LQHSHLRCSVSRAATQTQPQLNNKITYKFLVPKVYQTAPFHTSSSSSSSSVICQMTGPQPLPKRFLHLMRSRASSFK
jgi:hypothetical protein